MKKLTVTICIAVAIVVVAVLSFNQEKGSTETIKVGNLSALTGIGSAIGQEERNGVLLAVEEINARGGIQGRKIELVSEDLGFDNLKLGAALASKLITIDKVHAIVGPQWDEPADVVIPVTESNKIPMISGDVTNYVEKNRNYDYFFSAWYDNRSGIKKILSHAQSQGIKTISIIRPVDGGFWKFTADLMVEYSKDYGITIKDDLKLNDPFTTDYRTTLTKVKASNPDAIFIVVTDPTQCPFMKQVKELGLTMPIFGTEASGSHASLEACGDLLETLYFSTPKQGDSYKKFEEAYIKRFGKKPQYPSAVTSYDALGIVAQALDQTDFAQGEILRNAIAQTKDYKGASMSSITLDEKGYSITSENAWEIQTIKDGEFVKAGE